MTTKPLDCTHLIGKGIVRTERAPKGIVSRRQGNLAVVGARRFQYSPELVLRGALRQEIGSVSEYACVMAVLVNIHRTGIMDAMG
ncbi:hypothetical protein L210DRAFT_3559180 [Boletus edulis BED1]|uniref:Uncharacterized protein n=1 Tax=Boletus edulis BED1 TaxID=1328754 RepID=A0AAD4G9V2_BOLED|nr:hypothetical protein L210DRAFT_3559180 [Boletus edulis BED1]